MKKKGGSKKQKQTRSIRKKEDVIGWDPSSEIPVDYNDIPDPKSQEYTKGEIDRFHDAEEERNHKPEKEFNYVHTKQAAFDFPESDDEEELENRLRIMEAEVRRYQKEDDDDDDVEEEIDGDFQTEKAWGKNKKSFYGSDIRAKVLLHKKTDDILEEAEEMLEEREAISLQKQLANQLDEADFGLDFFAAPEPKKSEEKKETKISEELITSDLSQLSIKQKKILLNRKYPEFMNIVSDYRSCLVEYRDRLKPILKLNTQGKIPESDALALLKQKSQILLSYCCCCQFYLLLRAESAKVDGHPVIKRMTQMKQLLKEMSSAETKFETELDYLLEMISQGRANEIRVKKNVAPSTIALEMVANTQTETAVPAEPKPTQLPSVKSKTKSVTFAKSGSKRSLLTSQDPEMLADTNSRDMITKAEREAYEFYRSIKKERAAKNTKMEEAVEPDKDEYTRTEWDNADDMDVDKRGVTKEMMKNRGLTAHRKKELRTPRMKNRLKYDKKMRIHKSVVPEVRKELTRYSGEASGIRGGNIRSVPITR